jgi:hypothetical protein
MEELIMKLKQLLWVGLLVCTVGSRAWAMEDVKGALVVGTEQNKLHKLKYNKMIRCSCTGLALGFGGATAYMAYQSFRTASIKNITLAGMCTIGTLMFGALAWRARNEYTRLASLLTTKQQREEKKQELENQQKKLKKDYTNQITSSDPVKLVSLNKSIKEQRDEVKNFVHDVIDSVEEKNLQKKEELKNQLTSYNMRIEQLANNGCDVHKLRDELKTLESVSCYDKNITQKQQELNNAIEKQENVRTELFGFCKKLDNFCKFLRDGKPPEEGSAVEAIRARINDLLSREYDDETIELSLSELDKDIKKEQQIRDECLKQEKDLKQNEEKRKDEALPKKRQQKKLIDQRNKESESDKKRLEPWHIRCDNLLLNISREALNRFEAYKAELEFNNSKSESVSKNDVSQNIDDKLKIISDELKIRELEKDEHKKIDERKEFDDELTNIDAKLKIIRKLEKDEHKKIDDELKNINDRLNNIINELRKKPKKISRVWDITELIKKSEACTKLCTEDLKKTILSLINIAQGKDPDTSDPQILFYTAQLAELLQNNYILKKCTNALLTTHEQQHLNNLRIGDNETCILDYSKSREQKIFSVPPFSEKNWSGKRIKYCIPLPGKRLLIKLDDYYFDKYDLSVYQPEQRTKEYLVLYDLVKKNVIKTYDNYEPEDIGEEDRICLINKSDKDSLIVIPKNKRYEECNEINTIESRTGEATSYQFENTFPPAYLFKNWNIKSSIKNRFINKDKFILWNQIVLQDYRDASKIYPPTVYLFNLKLKKISYFRNNEKDYRIVNVQLLPHERLLLCSQKEGGGAQIKIFDLNSEEVISTLKFSKKLLEL